MAEAHCPSLKTFKETADLLEVLPADEWSVHTTRESEAQEQEQNDAGQH
jgi:hypothetical protein